MIINRKKATEAAAVLRLQLEDVTDTMINSAFKSMSKTAHPDAGGTVDEFVRLDHAKHVLLRWVAQKVLRGDEPMRVEDCKSCNGKGKVEIRRGFARMTIMCGRCKGSGDAGYDVDVTDT